MRQPNSSPQRSSVLVAEADPLRKRARVIAVGTALLLVSFAAGWGLAYKFQSPAQREAQAAPPRPKPIAAIVMSGELADKVAAQGTITYQDVAPLVPASLPSRAVVTAVRVRVGERLEPASQVSDVNGEPVFALASPFAFYRDLTAGMSGPDVKQMQQTLLQAKIPIPTNELGTYGPGTVEAVRAMYQRIGVSDSGQSLPLAAIARSTRLPAVVVSSSPVGTMVDDEHALATVGLGKLVVKAQLANASVARLKVGAAGTVQFGSAPLAVRLVRLGQATGDQTAGQTAAFFEPARAFQDSDQSRTVQITVPISVVAEKALLVPDRAVARTVSGEPYVLVLDGKSATRVRVRVLGSLAGISAVASDSDPPLYEGDKVQVG